MPLQRAGVGVAVVDVVQVSHIVGQVFPTSEPITTSRHLPAYSAWHSGGSSLPLQRAGVGVAVAAAAAVVVRSTVEVVDTGSVVASKTFV